MLQPAQDQQLATARLLWGALTFSAIIYGFLLFTTGKISTFFIPKGELLPIQILALASNILGVITFYLHKDRILPTREFSKRFPIYIICWAINESITVLGFVAVFLANDGNGFYYLTNLTITLLANALTFPKK